MNAYLSAMTDIVEEKGGFVDKYIVDAIVAVFGAPMDDPGPARRAVEAALLCRAQRAETHADPAQPFPGLHPGAKTHLCIPNIQPQPLKEALHASAADSAELPRTVP